MIDVEQTLLARFPAFKEKSKIVRHSSIGVLKRLAYQESINRFISEHQHLSALEFIDAVFEYFDFSYSISAKDKANIPAEGRLVVIANHPLGTLDGLALLRLISDVRRDVVILANDLLTQIEPLGPLLIPYNNMAGGIALKACREVNRALQSEKVVVVFPAGEVSRAGAAGVKDGKWRPGFLQFARRNNAPILPVHIEAKNSLLFYSASMLFKPLGTCLLPREMFQQRSRTIAFRVGQPIASDSLSTDKLRDKTLVKRVKKHVYKIGKNKKPIFQTLKTIAHPEPRDELQRALKQAQLLGQTRDGNRIYLVDCTADSPVMRELGRLREVAFRKVGEGTGSKRDLDAYDKHYRHLVLWDSEALQIAGAYRLAEGGDILRRFGKDGFYIHSLYEFDDDFTTILDDAVELGRSFVNPDYWGKSSLDYLWQGIGAYLSKYPARYLIGPVSMSAQYPKMLVDSLVYFFERYYAYPKKLAEAKMPYPFDEHALARNEALFGHANSEEALVILQDVFASFNLKMPVLFKQYLALFEEGGFQSLVFSVDPDFGDCLDGLCIADMSKIKPAKAKRYLQG